MRQRQTLLCDQTRSCNWLRSSGTLVAIKFFVAREIAVSVVASESRETAASHRKESQGNEKGRSNRSPLQARRRQKRVAREGNQGNDGHRSSGLRPAEGAHRAEYSVDFIPKVKVEVVVADTDLQAVLDTIVRAARTGQVGDGKIFVSQLTNVIRIRTGEADQAAL
jgi:nitrogen regulatory protein PII